MRPFFVRTAGATFFQGDTQTICIKKDYIEVICKVDKGLYVVVNLILDPDKVYVGCNWGHFFDRIYNHKKPEELLYRLKPHCPILHKLFCGDDNKQKVARFKSFDDITIVANEVVVDMKRPLLSIIADDKVMDAVEDIVNYTIDLNNEILTNCPFKDWQQGIADLINKGE